MLKTIVVSATDASYFALQNDLFNSLRRVGVDAWASFAVLDLGLSRDQADAFTAQGVLVYSPTSIYEFDKMVKSTIDRTVVARLFIPEYFPGYETYLWMDCDTWVQTDLGPREAVKWSATCPGAVAAERHPCYDVALRSRAWHFKHCLRALGIAAAIRLAFRTRVNAGIFAISQQSPLWDRWRRQLYRTAAACGYITPLDQFVLDDICSKWSADLHILPAVCNWICDKGPLRWDAERGLLTECCPPYAPVSVIHLAGRAKKAGARVVDADGNASIWNMQFSAVAGRLGSPSDGAGRV